MADEQNISGRPIAVDGSASSASETLPGFLAKPVNSPVYHGFKILQDVIVNGFTLGLITDFEEGGATSGDAFIVAPDGSRAGLVWEFSDNQEIEEVCPIGKDRWGVWAVSFPRRMSGIEDARMNLEAVLPKLKPKWEQWRRSFSQEGSQSDR